jgi:hypothetical protein
MACREIFQCLWNVGQEFDRLLRNRAGKSFNLCMQFGRDWIDAEAFECIYERVSKAVQAVAMLYDALPLHVIQDFPYLLWRKFVMIQERNEARDGAFEVDVVFPEGVVGIDQQSLGAIGDCGNGGLLLSLQA